MKESSNNYSYTLLFNFTTSTKHSGNSLNHFFNLKSIFIVSDILMAALSIYIIWDGDYVDQLRVLGLCTGKPQRSKQKWLIKKKNAGKAAEN